MAIADVFSALKSAEDSGDDAMFERVLSGSGLDPDAVTDAYIRWSSGGRVSEPNPLKQVAQGAQLGFTDELAGVGSAIGSKLAGSDKSFGDLYRKRRDAERAGNELYRKSNPGRSIALNMAGGLTTPILAKAAPLTAGGRVVQGAKVGATYGAAGGLGMGEGGILDQALQTAVGFGTGGILGGVLTGGVEAGKAGIAALRNRGQVAIPGVANVDVPKTITPEAVPLPQVLPTKDVPKSAGDAAKNQILAALEKDQVSLPELRDAVAARALDTTNPATAPLTISDLVPQGGATQRLGRGARVNAPGAAGRADQFLAQRDRLQGARVISTLDNTSGIPDIAPHRMQAQIEKSARDAAGPLYEQVRQAGEVDIRNLQPFVNTPEFQAAKAAVFNRPEFAGKNVNDAGVLDAIYKHIGGQRAGETNPQVAGYLKDTQAAIKQAIDAQTGGLYSKATAAFAGEIAPRDAIGMGGDILRKSATVVKDEMAGLDAAQRDVYRAAAADAIRERLRNLGYNRDAVKSIFNNDSIVQKFKIIMGSDKAFRDFERQMIDEARMVGTKQVYTGNSQTADKLRDAMDAGGYMDVLAGAVVDPGAAAANVARKAIGSRITGMLPGAEAKGEGILSMLLNPDTGSNIALLDALMAQQAAQRATADALGASRQIYLNPAVVGTQGLLPR